MKRFVPTFVGLGVALAAGAAHAQPAPTVSTYAIVVGSNAGGPGQERLQFAEDDARSVAETLTDLGGYAPGSVDILLHPTPAELRQHLDALAARVAADTAAGRQSRVLFYYSGHARADAIDLGADELPLAELRARLFAVPATLEIVVLDACQSGAFSRAKGAHAATDFSISSRQHLDASGVAVLASSAGSELSQESEELRASYFTHNLLVGLRGAGDTDHDGQVTLDEAYRYAYHQTLLATAATAIGGQHVSLEVELKGHGEVPLSFPRAATASITLPAALAGQAIVSDTRAHKVVAELYKAKGAPIRIALAPGAYDVLVRDGDHLERCAVAAPGEVDLATCRSEPLANNRRKGAGPARPFRLEVGGATGPERHDAYTDTLAKFGYHERFGAANNLNVALTRQLDDYLWLGVYGSYSTAPQWSYDSYPTNLSISYMTGEVGAMIRAMTPIRGSRWIDRWQLYGQAGGGLGIGRENFLGADGVLPHITHDIGYAMTAGAGLHFETALRGFGFSLGYQFDYAPIIDNDFQQTHASGGHRIALGLSFTE
ncbi:MAG TPA: caspase family protein [Kofleriaceae bacterium]|jgi:hypothetical protein